jgi:response regulator RpfG family c-di-GMP phosphodiesterase
VVLSERQLQNLEVAALLHNIGKMGIPDAILRKPGKLDVEEYALMKKHPEYGWAVLRSLPGFERAALDILHHHENYGGTGYPAGLRETEIPVVSRIVSVIDAFDAMFFAPLSKWSAPGRSNPPPNRVQWCAVRDPVVVQCLLTFAEAEMNTVFAAAGTAFSSAL